MDRLLVDIHSGFYVTPTSVPQDVIPAATGGAPVAAPLVTLTAHGATGAVTWLALDNPGYGSLPPGRALTDNGDGTATISGPRYVAFQNNESTGLFWTILARDALGNVGEVRYSARTTWADPPRTFRPAGGTVGFAGAYFMTAQRGTAVSWALGAGGSGGVWSDAAGNPNLNDMNAALDFMEDGSPSPALPDGLSLASNPPRIVGTPTTAGITTVSLMLWMSQGTAQEGGVYPPIKATPTRFTINVKE